MSFLPTLDAYRTGFQDKIKIGWGGDHKHTVEGVDAVEEAIDYLRNLEPMHELILSEDISSVAR